MEIFLFLYIYMKYIGTCNSTYPIGDNYIIMELKVSYLYLEFDNNASSQMKCTGQYMLLKYLSFFLAATVVGHMPCWNWILNL